HHDRGARGVHPGEPPSCFHGDDRPLGRRRERRATGATEAHLMPDYDYLVIGGGMTADAAVRGIREVDTSGSVALVGAEPHEPYNRPPLTKGLWKGDPESGIARNTPALDVSLHLGRRITGLD